MSYADTLARINAGDIIILDGGTGAELERRGVAMNNDAWCATAAMTDYAALVGVHQDYIAAGADIIITNSYASSRLMLEQAGLAEQVGEINHKTDQAALEARKLAQAPQVLVAGGLSHMMPMKPGHQELDRSKMPDMQHISDCLHELAVIHKDNGCDFILLEMMFDPVRISPAFTAAHSVDLPVWAGLSARRGNNGEVFSYLSDKEIPFREIVIQACEAGAEVMGVMHTASDLISEATGIIKQHHQGPLLTYPDSGYFKMPHWHFKHLEPQHFADYAQQWITDGIQIIGGCCGLGPEHIQALKPFHNKHIN